MDEKTLRSVIRLVVVFLLLISIILIVLSPVLGILFLVILGLIGTVLWITVPEFHNILLRSFIEKKEIIESRKEKRKKVGTQPLDISFNAEYRMISRRENGKAYLIDSEMFLIGRSSSCSLKMTANPAASNEHCRIVYRKFSHEYYIEDLHSESGTYVGAKRLQPYTQEKLLPDSEITIAGWTYDFVRIPQSESEEP